MNAYDAARLSRLSLAGRIDKRKGLVLFCGAGEFASPYGTYFVPRKTDRLARHGKPAGSRAKWRTNAFWINQFNDWRPIGGLHEEEDKQE